MIDPSELFSTDVGSIKSPSPDWDEKRYNLGASLIEQSFYTKVDLAHESVEYFAEEVYKSLIFKLQAGIETPCIPQLRPMGPMFEDNYKSFFSLCGMLPDWSIENGPERGIINPEYIRIAEVEALKDGIKEVEDVGQRICEKTGQRPLEIKVCVSDPLVFWGKMSADYIAGLVVSSIIDTKYIKTKILTIDAPNYGRPTVGEDILQKYDTILYGANCRNVIGSLHTHVFERELLDLKNARMFEFHTNSIKLPESLAKDFKDNDLIVQAGIARTDLHYAEPQDLIDWRLKEYMRKFPGLLAYVSPDCGLVGREPKVAELILKRVAKATNNAKKYN